MIADAKLNGSVAKGAAVAHYMLNPDAKINDDDVKKMQASKGAERILHIETDHANPILIGSCPKKSAKSFMNGVLLWNRRNRPGKKPPQSHWEHRVVSLHPADSKKLNPKDACDIARESLNIAAPGERPALYVVHGDKEHLHVHMLYSTVNETGKIYNLHRDYRVWEAAMEVLEIKYGLHRVQKRAAYAHESPLREPDGTNPKASEFRQIQRTNEPSHKQKLRQLIQETIDDCKSASGAERFSRFMSSLRSKNIGVSVNIQSTGRVVGLRFHYGIFSKRGIRGSALGKAYSWPKLASTIAFDQNPGINTKILKFSDHRIIEWVNHQHGGKQYAAEVGTFYNNKVKNSNKNHTLPSAVGGSSLGSSESITPHFPEDCPEWMKSYIRAIVSAANAELARVHQKNQELAAESIKIVLQLLNAIVKSEINRLFKQAHSKQPSNRLQKGVKHAPTEKSRQFPSS
ncbi:relaxase/mobilization nuclease domain-containing protein [Endozoicomonas sp.]|uniref:relaxase/mobilization nuclease domain-containing protein n=1 Tax=Endozoicomonas sp. TaxID=1892382 RepID=UPI003AF97D4D